jgi:hypothetical protein
MFHNTLFFNLSISLFLWNDNINTEINASVYLLALLFWNGVQWKLGNKLHFDFFKENIYWTIFDM